MKSSRLLSTLVLSLAVGLAGTARAGAPQPDTRQSGFPHVCKGGSSKGLACTVATQDTDCPGSECVVQTVSASVRGVLTLVAHDSVTDWANGQAGTQALTVMLEVRAPDGTQQMLAATYQDLAVPTNPPTAPSSVVAIAMDEFALQDLAVAVNGLLFVRPESTLMQQLQTLFGTTGIPVLVDATDRRVQLADHTGDGLATVLRFKVRIQFVAAP